MTIKHLCKTKEDYITFVTNILDWKEQPNREIWKSEDMPKLQAFFKWEEKGDEKLWNTEVSESFEYLKKCSIDYANTLHELRDSLRNIPIKHLLEAFYFNEKFDYDTLLEFELKYSDDWEKRIAELGSFYILDEEEFIYTFPLIIAGTIDSGFDRLGNIGVLDIHIITLADFNFTNTKSK